MWAVAVMSAASSLRASGRSVGALVPKKGHKWDVAHKANYRDALYGRYYGKRWQEAKQLADAGETLQNSEMLRTIRAEAEKNYEVHKWNTTRSELAYLMMERLADPSMTNTDFVALSALYLRVKSIKNIVTVLKPKNEKVEDPIEEIKEDADIKAILAFEEKRRKARDGQQHPDGESEADGQEDEGHQSDPSVQGPQA